MIFIKNGYICSVDRFENEPYDNYCDRGWFIVSQIDDKTKDMSEIIRYSRLWANYKLHGCVYSDKIMKKVKEMDKKV